ncbi:gamma-glutamylcyclotransferase family protein [Leptodesmis sp.]|uniref:gamma-glutamylcyclotransferase family protein n=1 Tax=Leptodesmis sp. TaxID=3100501 RepID=UPI00405353C7
MSDLIKVFVYGTLKPGEVKHSLCVNQAAAPYPAIVQGQLYHLPLGYPAMTLDKAGIVHGFVLSFSDSAILQTLDEYEQHAPEYFQEHAPDLSLEAHQYRRLQIATFHLDHSPLDLAWCYVMTSQQITALRGRWVASGDWTRNWAN